MIELKSKCWSTLNTEPYSVTFTCLLKSTNHQSSDARRQTDTNTMTDDRAIQKIMEMIKNPYKVRTTSQC